MGFSLPRKAGLPETSHIMWIVFMINFQRSPLFGRVPKDPLPHHYHVSCIHGLRKNCRNTKAFSGNHPRPLPLCPDLLLSILCRLGCISYSWFHRCLPRLGNAVCSSQLNALLHPLPPNKGHGSDLLFWNCPTVNRLLGMFNLICSLD